MGLAKRIRQTKSKSNKFDPELFDLIRKEIEKLEKSHEKRSRFYTHLRAKFTKMGYKPFAIMAHYQAHEAIRKGEKDLKKAFEIGVKIAAAIAQRKYGRR